MRWIEVLAMPAKPKAFQTFWIGSTKVSRCARCGGVMFSREREEEHQGEPCDKARLKPLTDQERDGPGKAA